MIFGKLKLYAIIAAGAFLAVLGAFFAGDRIRAAKSKTDALQKRLKDAGRARHVQDSVQKKSDADVRKSLSRWMRDE